MLRPTSLILQTFNFDSWVLERVSADIIEIVVTKEISVCVEETRLTRWHRRSHLGAEADRRILS